MDRRLSLVLAPLLFIAAFAGCVQDKAPDEPAPDGNTQYDAIPPFPIEEDHDHSDPAAHDASANFEAVAYHSGYGSGNASEIPAGQGFSELFVRPPYAFLGRRGGADGGFIVFDVSNQSSPKRLGAFQGLANYDMESTEDNKFVFFVSQYINNQQPESIPPNDPGELPRQIHLVDINDPKNPTWVGAMPVPTRGVHTITYYKFEDGREILAAQTYDFTPDPSLGLPIPGAGVNMVSQRVLLLEFKRTPEPHLELLSTWEKHPTDPTLAQHAFPHDSFIQKHPLTGDVILYVAYWDLGAFLVNINDPAKPTEISHLTDFSPSTLKLIHLAVPSDELYGGRHLTITEPELGGNEPETGQYTIFDTTDPAKPTRLGHWRLPGNMSNQAGLRFSPHNFDVEDGRLTLAHYHAGVWVVDVGTPGAQANPQALAFHQTTAARPGYTGDIPNVWTALEQDGYVYASDIATGLHILQYTGPETHSFSNTA